MKSHIQGCSFPELNNTNVNFCGERVGANPDLIRNKLIQMYLVFINDKSKKLSIKLSKTISLHPSAVFYPILTLNCTCKVKYLDFKDLNSYFF